jgi:adenylate cyclase
MEYTAIGDAVNVAARVESLTKELGESLLLTEATRNALRGRVMLDPFPLQHVKGHHAAIEVFRLAKATRR